MNRGLVPSFILGGILILGSIGLLLAGTSVSAQEKKEEKVNAASILPRIPPVEPLNALDGMALIAAMRQGGFVMYIRHAETGEVTETCEKSNLTAQGREMAVAIGSAMNRLNIPIGKAISSDVCRALETAKLMAVAPVEINEDLHRAPKRPDHRIHEARLKLIGTPPPPGTNTLLAGHMQHGEKPEHRLYLDMGEIVVFKPRGDGTASVVARVRPNEWQAFIAKMSVPPGK